jgi:hypothetical protein
LGKREGGTTNTSYRGNPDGSSGLLVKGAVWEGRQEIQTSWRQFHRRRESGELVIW